MAPFTIVQLTDPHIGADWIEDPAGSLAAAVEAVLTVLPAGPDATVVTGDIANSGRDAEYEQARSMLDELRAPVYAVPGNHDDRDAMRRHFELPDGPLLNYAAELGAVRLIALDTKRDDSDTGQLDRARLAWLERALAEDAVTPTLIALHHPPLASGLGPMDAIGISAAETAALAEIIAAHPQVQLIVGGHVHRTIVSTLGGAPVLALASTADQLKLDFDAAEMRFIPEPASVAIHALVERRLVSHIQPV